MVTKGEKTRAAILETAVDIASVEGLEGLTIGRLANSVSMSKSGLFGHFGSKEELQLATVVAARNIFIQEVITPALQAPRGLQRLWALCDGWLDYMEREVFPGGCFFMSTSVEFDHRPGPVKDAIVENMREWLQYLTGATQMAQSQGEIKTSLDPAQLVFELHGFYMSANWEYQLFDDKTIGKRARLAILTRLYSAATSDTPPLPPLPSTPN
jgi:AcrR family transcriptional regulator